MKNPFNLRLPVILAGALTVGIVYSAVLAYFGLSGMFILIPAVAAFAACAITAIFTRTAKIPSILVLAIILYLVGAVYAFGKYFSFCQTEIFTGSAEVCGSVESTGVTSGGNLYLILRNVTFGGERVNGKLIAYLGENAGDYCRRGYTVSFYSSVSLQEFIEYGEISYNATRGVKYVCNVSGGLKAQYAFNLFGEINYAFERALYNNLDGETAAVCFAMLTGDTDGISAGTLSSFRNGGIAHIFAVSGLHIGVIFAALTYLLKKVGVNRYVSTAVRIAVILLYSGVCAYSPSSVRALVMCSVGAIASCLFRKNDSLNSLCIAAIIVLLINPFYMFQIGFTLSFGCMFGIVLLRNTFKKLLSFLPKKLSGALAVGWSAQFGSIPAQLTGFGYVSWAGLFLNAVFIPVISVLYVIVFVCVLVCSAIPPAGIILPVVCAPLQFVINLIVSCGFERAVISGSFNHLLYLPFILFTVILTDKFNFRIVTRAAVTAVFAIAVLGFAVAPLNNSVGEITFGAGYGGGSVLIETRQGSVLIITSGYVRRGNLPDVSAVVVVGDGYDAVNSIDCAFDSLYMSAEYLYLPVHGNFEKIFSDNFELFGISFEFDGKRLRGCLNGVSFTVSDGEFKEEWSADFNLYCPESYTALLYCGNEGYSLAKCGEMRYDIKGWGYIGSYVCPKE